jgi:hypothetical protein
MESQQEAVKRIEIHLKKIFVERLGKNPDPQALKAEAEDFVAQYGPDADLKDILA